MEALLILLSRKRRTGLVFRDIGNLLSLFSWTGTSRNLSRSCIAEIHEVANSNRDGAYSQQQEK